MVYSWQFDPLEPDKPVELTCDGVVIATTSLKNAEELAHKLNSQSDLYEACKAFRDAPSADDAEEAVKLMDKALSKAEGGK